MPPLIKVVWVSETILILSPMFIAGKWYKDPSGNYEPVIVGLGLAIALVAIGIKFATSKKLNNTLLRKICSLSLSNSSRTWRYV